MKLSSFGQKFAKGAGINTLMDDLGKAMKDKHSIMMGGGNPGIIPEVEALFQKELARITQQKDEFRNLTGIYDPPQGDLNYIRELAKLFREEYDWPITEKHIALTNGSQSAFFMLFNMFAGEFEGGRKKRVLLPMTPEYIGYADSGLSQEFFVSAKPVIERLGDHRFKYHVDFNNLPLDETVGLMCVSRPTNPTGNVLTDEEMNRLIGLAGEYDIPFVVDGAYGLPFPNLVFNQVKPVWDDHLILCLSLSKFGLPAVRTGIVIAKPEIIEAISSINAIINLAPSSFGAVLTHHLIESREILFVSENVIRPFYQRKAQLAVNELDKALQGIPYAVHQPEGAMFLWLWLPGFPETSQQLYERLKARGVIVVPGHHFFPGLKKGWDHTEQCIRLTYSQDDGEVKKGIQIMADEIKTVYGCQ